ncbi:hypothetical protein ACGFZG_37115 [Streptomyces antibioticus]|uniref:hypothetical protein n=1 Tax=Streptomyces antibioticus TaxID=1890 RepID=UPI00371A44F3
MLVEVPPQTSQPLSVRQEAYRLVTGMLGDPDTAERLALAGASVVVLPKDTPLTEIDAFAAFQGGHDQLGHRPVAELRGGATGSTAVIAEENLLGEETPVGPHRHEPEGYSSATHEIAHLVHTVGLSEQDRAIIDQAWRDKRAEGHDVQWPDGKRRRLDGSPAENYGSSDPHEYFAQVSNAFLGTNHGTDGLTGQPRNNGRAWVREHEPRLAPLLERLYGSGPEASPEAPANPVHTTSADNARFRAFTDFMTGAAGAADPVPDLPGTAAVGTSGPALTRSAPVDTSALHAMPLADTADPEAVVSEDAVPAEPAELVSRFGDTDRRSTPGLVSVSPFVPWTVTVLHDHIARTLGIERGAGQTGFDAAPALTAPQLAEHLPALLSVKGHRVTVPTGGRERVLRVRLALAHEGLPEWYGESGVSKPRQRVERRAMSTQSASNQGSYQTSRTIPLGWTGVFPILPRKPLLTVIGSAQLTFTHNQMSSTTKVGSSVRTLSNLNSSESAEPHAYRVRWQVREETDDRPTNEPREMASSDDSAWQDSEQAGTVTVWFPEHLASDRFLAPEGAEPAALDDLPLWNVDSLTEPERLADEVRELFADVLAPLGAESRAEAEALFSEPRVRGAMPLLRHGAYSPLLLDADGQVVGMFRLTAVVDVGAATRTSVPGATTLESHIAHGRSVAGSSRLTSGMVGEVSVSVALGSGHVPRGGTSAGSATLTARGGGSVHLTKTLGSGGSVSLKHSLASTAAHLLTKADVTYTVDFVRTDGSILRHGYGTWDDALRLRILRDEDARGIEPVERRALPPELEQVRSIGLSGTVLDVQGAEEHFAAAETYLRQRGFLPAATDVTELASDGQDSAPPRVPAGGPSAASRLENLRRFELARNLIGLRALSDSAVDGGHALWLDDPTAVPARRVQLRLTLERDPDEPSRHARTLPRVSTFNTAAQADPGAEEEGTGLGLYAGAGLSGNGSVPGGKAWLTGGVDGRHDWQWGRTEGATTEVGHDQTTWSDGQASEVFDIPVTIRLALYGEDPHTPIAEFRPESSERPESERSEDPGPGRPDSVVQDADEEAPTAVVTNPAAAETPQPAEPSTPGILRIAVPHDRTLPDPGPRSSPPPAIPLAVPRPVTQDDLDKLALVNPDGSPREGVIRIPGDAVIDVFAGSRDLIAAFGTVVSGMPATAEPDEDNSGESEARSTTGGLAAMVPARAARAGSSAARMLAGDAPVDQRTLMTETLRAALSPEQLLSRGHQILGGGYVVEGLALPGSLADGEYSVELRGYAHKPRSVTGTRQYQETGISSADGASHATSRASGPRGTASVGGRPDVRSRPSAGARIGSKNSMVTPVLSYAVQRRTATSRTVGSSAEFARTATEGDRQHRLRGTVTVVMTVRRGHRNIATGLFGQGQGRGVTVALDLPQALDVLLTDAQIRRNAQWFTGIPELADIVASADAADGVPRPALPALYAATGELGGGSVLDCVELTEHQPEPDPDSVDPTPPPPLEVPAQGHPFRDGLLAQIDKEAPGAMRPGNSSYVPGLRSRIVAATDQDAMRALPGRGPKGVRRFHFLYTAMGGTRLVEVELRARPRDDAQGLRTVRGRSVVTGSGLETVSSSAPSLSAGHRAWTTSHQASLGLITRHPRAGDHMVGDRTGPTLGAGFEHARSVTRSTAWQDRSWTESGSSAEYDVVYTYTTSVRSAPVADWPPDLVGGYVNSGVISWNDTPDLRSWLIATFAGRTPLPCATAVRTTLRFAAQEPLPEPASQPRPIPFHRPADHPVPPSAAVTPPLRPTDAVIVYGFDGAPLLRDALAEAHPDLPGQGIMEALDSQENAAVRLGELIRSGTARIGPDQPRPMPGTWPDADVTTVTAELHDPQPVSTSDDIALARGLLNSSSHTSTSAVALAPTLSWSTALPADRTKENQRIAIGTAMISPAPLRSAQASEAADAHRERLKASTTDTAGTPGRRTHEAEVNVLITVRNATDEPRHVYGTTTVRLAESDLLGYGVTPARPQPRVYDLRSLLRDQPTDALRDWARHPLADLPQTLAAGVDGDDPAVQLWLAARSDTTAAGEDTPPAVGRALYAAMHVARLTGKPVELFLRTEHGTQRWLFDTSGELRTADDRIRQTWGEFATPARRLADAAREQTRLADQEHGLSEQLGPAQAEVERTAAALREAEAERDALLDQTRDRREETASPDVLAASEATVSAARRASTEAVQRAHRLTQDIAELQSGQRAQVTVQDDARRLLATAVHHLEIARSATREGDADPPDSSLTTLTTRRPAQRNGTAPGTT